MRLRRLAIQKLYGSLDKEVDFNDDLSLLVGINGSGKTSVLNLVQWMLNTSIGPLCTTQFDRVTLSFDHDGASWVMDAVQDDATLNVYLRTGAKEFHPFHVRLLKPAKEIADEQETAELRGRYLEFGPEPKEMPFVAAVAAFPKPIAISLDRTLVAEAEQELFSEPTMIPPRRRAKQAQNALDKVREVAAMKHAVFRNKVYHLNEELKAKLVMSAFRVPNAATQRRPGALARSIRDIDQLERRAITYLSSSIRAPDVTTAIKNYFRVIREMSSRPGSKKEQWLLSRYFANQYEHLSSVADAFNEFEQQTSAAHENAANVLRHDERLSPGQSQATFIRRVWAPCLPLPGRQSPTARRSPERRPSIIR